MVQQHYFVFRQKLRLVQAIADARLSAEFDVVELWSREWHDRTQQTLSSFIDEVKQAFMAFFRKKLLILIKDGQATRERIDQLGLLTSNFDELWEMEFAYDCEEYEVAIRELP